MTGKDIKTIIDIVHKTIYGFFDVCDEEVPMTDKDKLLLEINKAICSNIKTLECEPCEVITPQPKMGRWIDDKCSVCGKGIEDLISSSEWYVNEEPNFCPFCGLKMEEVEK